ncbi:sensor histidine kinase [Cohnella abietis]|uniref:HAMP domain-containing protein n=1 Tax=Cohnella abietis TaxID=2507935 RepID=A0A3T1D1B8_9BACL|nr:sensor histidine kinase [Cohnella abietis]BBI31886.1 hypothetical protein KCTCHS21_12850 [Cohnella abietis]
MTLRMKVILGFCVMTIPLVCFLIYTNYYSSKVVREQVANFNSGLLTLYGDQIDQTLANDNSFLYKLATQEPLVRSLIYNLNNEDEYSLTRAAVSNKLYTDATYYNSFDVLFAYVPNNRDLIVAQLSQKSYGEEVQIQSFLRELFTDDGKTENHEAYDIRWTNCQIGDDQFLLRIVRTDTNTYIGALIKNSDLMRPLQVISKERNINSYFLRNDGQWIDSVLPDASDQVTAAIRNGRNAYQTVKGHEKYLLVYHRMKLSDLVLTIMIPENEMLQQVPLFQRITYVIPFVAGALLLIFLMYLQKLVIKPMQHLIKGMRQIGKGNLDARLSTRGSLEFTLIDDTFNNMVSQIQDLKIHVYEEEIRSHKAELKQLQLQLNPHFLFNSLNIIYNLAETKKYDLIQQMSRHMVSYLRFFAHLRDNHITVQDEMNNVDHYMQIQKLRFPKHLEYEWRVEEAVMAFPIPPLLIQPFVENAIKHGFSTKDNVFRINVHAGVRLQPDRECDYCEIRIEDNGRGLPSELTDNLAERLEDRTFTDEHIGIWNVYNQLKMMYRGEAEMVFTNLVPHGARVTIRIPMYKDDREGGKAVDV